MPEIMSFFSKRSTKVHLVKVTCTVFITVIVIAFMPLRLTIKKRRSWTSFSNKILEKKQKNFVIIKARLTTNNNDNE